MAYNNLKGYQTMRTIFYVKSMYIYDIFCRLRLSVFFFQNDYYPKFHIILNILMEGVVNLTCFWKIDCLVIQ